MAYQQRQQQAIRDYQQARGQAGKPKLKEAQNLYKNWTKSLEKIVRHLCDPKTQQAKDDGKKKLNPADFRKVQDAAKYGISVTKKSETDEMSLAELETKYGGVISSYRTYIGTGYFNPLGNGESRVAIERYLKLKAEEEALVAAKVAEWNQYHAWTIYDTIRATGLKPNGSKPTNTELDIANSDWYPWLKNVTQTTQLASSISSAYIGYQKYYGKSIYGVNTNWLGQPSNPKVRTFKHGELENHYNKHGQQVANAQNKTSYSIQQYLDDANNVIHLIFI